MVLVSPWVPAALPLMAAALLAISSKAAESCWVRLESSRTLPLEVSVLRRTSCTTPLMRWELPWSIPMASRMGAMTYRRTMRNAAATRRTPRSRVTALVTRAER